MKITGSRTVIDWSGLAYELCAYAQSELANKIKIRFRGRYAVELDDYEIVSDEYGGPQFSALVQVFNPKVYHSPEDVLFQQYLRADLEGDIPSIAPSYQDYLEAGKHYLNYEVSELIAYIAFAVDERGGLYNEKIR